MKTKRTTTKSKRKRGKKVKVSALKLELNKINFKADFTESKIRKSLESLSGQKDKKVKLPFEQKKSLAQLKPKTKRFHGIRLSKFYFPSVLWRSKCKNTFCYMTSKSVRKKSKLPFKPATIALLHQLGNIMGDPNRDTGSDSNIPAGYTYFGQFVDHDITLDVSSRLDIEQDASSIDNMRTPKLDLDSIYGRGPGLDPFLYDFSSGGTAIKMQLGTNTNVNMTGGPSSNSGPSGMQILTDFDVPRVSNSDTAVIGDPRNDENLIVSQLHHTMLKFHNKVVDMLQLAGFPNDIFIEAKRIVTHHYQWVVVHDFLSRICGTTVVKKSIKHVRKSKKFCIPVEFSVAAYRFGHSMIRNSYWINFNFPNASLGEVFQFIRGNNIPVLSNWVVDFNSFFPTGKSVPVNNMARKIDSFLASGLEDLPGTPSGFMSVLATRNLRRSVALGLPSGQETADYLGVPKLSNSQLKSGLMADEKALLDAQNGHLLKRTPLWYYILREAKVKKSGDQLGPLGAKIVSDTFIKMLKSDPDSFLNKSGGFTPSLPSTTANFELADIIKFSGVNLP